MEFHHISIMLEECIKNLRIKPTGIYVDGTMGGAGHSKEIAKHIQEGGLLVGIDQDENAIQTGKERLAVFGDRVKVVRDNFRNIKSALENIGIQKIDGVLLDLGVSSHQLDEASRGFSYQQDAPLDMRMDQRASLSAYDVVNRYSEEEIAKLIFTYGEDRWAKRIAKFIVEHRERKPIESTGELVDIIKKAIPAKAREEGPHPAKRTFQAIRIEVNNELGIIADTIKDVTSILNPGGRICIITFHSLEDRIVKQTFKELSTGCICPPQFPVCICGNTPKLTIISRKPIEPSAPEVEENPRARSAKLRVAEKL